MTAEPAAKTLVLSSDHAAIGLRQAIAAHVSAQGWQVEDIGPTTPESTPYPQHGAAAARRVASGEVRFGIILCVSLRRRRPIDLP